jgi:hypothetical protein
MDTARFDGLTRLLGSSVSGDTLTRRAAVRGLMASGLAVVAGGSALELVDAKRRRKKGKQGKRQSGGGGAFLPAGAFCQQDAQCDPLHTKRICAVAVNAGNSDETCCGATGALCGAPNEDGDDTFPFCCVGYQCISTPGQSNGVCQPVPDEI